jgi:hypothetical protein
MVRVFVGLTLGLALAGCAGGDDALISDTTEPTADFDIIPPEVDTAWPHFDTDLDTVDSPVRMPKWQRERVNKAIDTGIGRAGR